MSASSTRRACRSASPNFRSARSKRARCSTRCGPAAGRSAAKLDCMTDSAQQRAPKAKAAQAKAARADAAHAEAAQPKAGRAEAAQAAAEQVEAPPAGAGQAAP